MVAIENFELTGQGREVLFQLFGTHRKQEIGYKLKQDCFIHYRRT